MAAQRTAMLMLGLGAVLASACDRIYRYTSVVQDTRPAAPDGAPPATCTAVAQVPDAGLGSCAGAAQPGWIITWPDGEELGTGCTTSDGLALPATGIGAADWFLFNGCGAWKTYPVADGCSVVISAYGECCPGCVLKEIDYAVYEGRGGVFDSTPRAVVQPGLPVPLDCGEAVPAQQDTQHFVPAPQTTEIKIVATIGFHACVFLTAAR